MLIEKRFIYLDLFNKNKLLKKKGFIFSNTALNGAKIVQLRVHLLFYSFLPLGIYSSKSVLKTRSCTIVSRLPVACTSCWRV